MRVGIDARTLEREEEVRGIGVLVSDLVDHLPGDAVDLVLFYSRPPDRPRLRGRGREVVLRLPAGEPRRVLRIIWEQLLLPLALLREPLDLFHAPANRGVPLLGRGRFIGGINDAIPLVTPYFFDSRPDPPLLTWLLRLVYRALVGVVALRSVRIITLSESSRQDLARIFPWAATKLRVIYPGPDPRYHRVEDAGQIRWVLERHGLPSSFLIYVGGLGQRKNVAGLLRSYALLARRTPAPPALVVVGAPNVFYPSLQALAQELGIRERVHFTGFVPAGEMPALLSAAELLVYPSFYEGFGLPVLEAMACGCPVVCSQTSSLPEVGGEAVLYCDPGRPDDIAEKIERLLSDRTLRSRFVEAGYRRSREFTMERMIAGVLSVYREALARGESPSGPD